MLSQIIDPDSYHGVHLRFFKSIF